MAGYRGRHRKPSSNPGKTIATTAITGVVIGAPLATAGQAYAASDASWDRLAKCESGGKWSTNTGNGYNGGLQFSPSTWRAYGGTKYANSAHQASREEQIAVAEKVLAEQGWNAWPSCSRKTGVRGESHTVRAITAKKKATPKSIGRKTLTPDNAARPVTPGSDVTSTLTGSNTTPGLATTPRADKSGTPKIGRLEAMDSTPASTDSATTPFTAMPVTSSDRDSFSQRTQPATAITPSAPTHRAPTDAATERGTLSAPTERGTLGAPAERGTFTAPTDRAAVAPTAPTALPLAEPSRPSQSGRQIVPESNNTPAPLAQSPTGRTPAAPKVAKTPRTYQVQEGDSLSSIAKEQKVNGGWESVYKSNESELGGKHTVKPGQKLELD
ncbi:hypothetical protein GCM10023321_03340 [Pseudonocardia eucalypti]|uniref:LysM domain-containing protein n=1 Tax=Pseudonocardia eucalypti TaxID=648755 RepID=A0ABP9PEP7_9PSEU|nr:hypothetical protein [Pseudonocardia eucalypti]